ncbi:lysozyme inhibitor LprI family protein [Methylomicrobium sp. RS1]|uniref:lysozyme inhibitor LprI family protein n=1 Tax=Candidatus Methylomicrobium oryzae TaxID=2802053 RepID=UPI001922E66D|nr:lysozyme inhibitor LprI family protein [Methylomicrobium sp. RS1]MBL1262060.1 DUF1311 domain-containing protein [Methylomicrobium sp. RS1]
MKKIILNLAICLLPFTSFADSEYDNCISDGIAPAECSGEEYDRQDKRLNIAYKSAMKSSADQNLLKQQQREWIELRDASCPKPDDDNATAHSYDMHMQCLSRITESRANELEKIVDLSINSANTEVDYDDAVNAMNAPYLAYGNGAYAMFKAENECWESIGNATDAERCMAMLMAGAFIEAAWAQKQGRVPVPNYQGDAATKRMEENLAKAKIPEEEKQMARNNFKKNGNRIIPSMINVGALGR